MKKLSLVVALAASVLVPATASAATPLKISVLSVRPDLVSGGDALVRVAPVSALGGLKLAVNGKPRSTKPFASVAAGWEGLLTGLKLGKNTVVARSGGRAAQLVLTNHPKGGPVFSGPQLQPWVCQASAKDKQCNEPATYSFLYKSTDSSQSGFQSYDPKNPPSDVATTKTDQGVEVPFIVRVEA